jgi:diaminopimelate epimerase
MRLQFAKMHGLGNDFVVIDRIGQRFDLTPERARLLADRRRGVGCDQILLVEEPAEPGVDFNYRIINADGGEVEQCGNGARCFAVFVRRKGLTDKDTVQVLTSGARMKLHIGDAGAVSVEMGVPEFDPERVPFLAPERRPDYQIEVDGTPVTIAALAIGNPHAVQMVKDVDDAPVERIGSILESHPLFPRRVNAGFMQVVDRSTIRLRVYERGVGETLACGSGACAAVAAGRQWNLLDEVVGVQLRGGELNVKWPGAGHPVTMTGTANYVYEGEIELE